MKVLILSTFGNYGGAAVCSKRLKQALEKHGIEVNLGVMHSFDDQTSIFIAKSSWLSFIKKWFLFILERIQVLVSIRHFPALYKFSTGSSGYGILNNPLVKSADVIHLHWVNFGFVSINEIARLSTVKPVIWTMHDMWAFTGGCHYALTCDLYQKQCGSCFYLRNNSSLSNRILNNKAQLWKQSKFKLVATSQWLAGCANKSTLFNSRNVEVLSTPIDTDIFKPLVRNGLRNRYKLNEDRFYVLFGAVDLSDDRKGFKYLLRALDLLKDKIPSLHLLTFGKVGDGLFPEVAHTSFGHVDRLEKLNEIYNLADVFVLPSIQDNLPNTVMESLACGVPVVAFDSGGVSDMVDHFDNGYLAKNMDSQDLAHGILCFYNGKIDFSLAGKLARGKIVNHFSESVAVEKHLTMYKQLTGH